MSPAHSVGSSHSHSFFLNHSSKLFPIRGRRNVDGQCSGTSGTVYPGLTGEARVALLLPEQLISILRCRFEVTEQLWPELLANKLFSSRVKKHSEGHISLRGWWSGEDSFTTLGKGPWPSRSFGEFVSSIPSLCLLHRLPLDHSSAMHGFGERYLPCGEKLGWRGKWVWDYFKVSGNSGKAHLKIEATWISVLRSWVVRNLLWLFKN